MLVFLEQKHYNKQRCDSIVWLCSIQTFKIINTVILRPLHYMQHQQVFQAQAPDHLHRNGSLGHVETLV